MVTADDALLLHRNLSRWIEINGGSIHKNLALHTPSPQLDVKNSDRGQDMKGSTTDYTHRGIFALEGPIIKGEELIRLPAALALDGHALPVSYCEDVSGTSPESVGTRSASNWLRCIASFMHTLYLYQCKKDSNRSSPAVAIAAQEQPSVKYAHYITSLPKKYDSLLEWTTWEIRYFLAGTALSVNALQSVTDTDTSDISESQHDDALRLRYRTTVVPYLKYLQQNLEMFLSEEENESNSSISSSMSLNYRERKRRKRMETQTQTQDDMFEELYPLFREACMCISSRAFHMQLRDVQNETHVGNSADYHGPYLLPYIDLLNHSPHSSSKHVTTLRRSATDGSFVMIAERDIAVGEEICHSYDIGNGAAENESNSSFTSAQTLQTYGFVDLEQTRIIDLLLEDKDKCLDGFSVSTLESSITPAVLTKSEVCKSCDELSRSTYVADLRNSMQQSGMLEEGWEYWDLPSPSSSWDGARCDALNNLPDELLISSDASITDELITICCLYFIPDETLNELLQDEHTFLLNTEVLEDFFLGKLVLQAIIDAVKAKLKSYKVQVNWSDLKEDASALLQVLSKVFESDDRLDSSSLCWGENVGSDARVLSKLKSSSVRSHSGVDKFMYGLVVSLEERACLIELRKKACDMIVQI